ncbi:MULTISPECIES: DNA translocase FtsK [Bacillaceae]|uniref:DNA translocase FtsK n=1 Tax=Bacillaceae TaxID=186817 RepID=UPI0002A50381|nr:MULTISPECIES: DNA translocase FtsK [Bacillaceae]ELK47336.1 DNA translocase SftA [Halobacillus sp. BAB-2008]
MWKDIKSKMKKWFENDEAEEKKPLHNKDERFTNERQEVNARTKMTYRYPKQGEFRFPVIPDRPKHPSASVEEEEKTLENRPVRRQRPFGEQKKQEEPVRRKQRKQEEEQELPETTSVPFTPTDVPSPIYGYQARQMTKGLETLEYAVEEEQQKGFYTNSYDEKQWQELRKRMRIRMDEPEPQRPVTESENQIPTVEELADEEIKEKSNVEEAASLELETPQEEAARGDDMESFQKAVQGFDNASDEPSQVETPARSEEVDSKENDPLEAHESEPLIDREPEEPFTGLLMLDEEEVPETEEGAHEDVEQPLEDPAPSYQDSVSEADLPVSHDEEEVYEGDSSRIREEEMITEEELVDRVETEDNSIAETPESTIPSVTEEDENISEDKPEDHEAVEVSDEKPVEEKPKRRVPFNVLMTPRDKRTRDHQPVPPQNKKVELKEEERKVESNREMKQDSLPQETDDKPGHVREEYVTPLHLLEDPVRPTSDDDSWIKEQMELLETTLRHFHVRANVVNAMKGPTVTRFEVQPEPGVKVSKITNLADDIKLSMAAKDIRIEAPIPGKQAVGIEVPNKRSQMVGLQEIFESEAFQEDPSPLAVGLGLDIGGDSIVTNLKKMPHGLIAGATGSGKSVCINTILISLLYKAHHEDVKFMLIDPKMVELAPYNDLPHLVSPVITDVKAATTALKWAVKEMEERYEKFVKEGVRDVERYNDKIMKQGRKSEKMPYLVIVIDELADLMMMSPQDVEDAICRIAQKARACGIHLLLATQRPSVDVITGLIKANIPTRIAFSVSSQVDSRTIIDSSGAEKLLGKGDMLFVENGSGQPLRIQGAFVSDDEIERVTAYVKKVAPPRYLFHQDELIQQVASEEDTDELFDEAVSFVVEQNGASASLIQRRFKVGYNRAARLIDQMETYGIISEQKGSKPRDILLTRQQIDEMME